MNDCVVLEKDISRTYPQVKEKALVDLVNGIEVVRDHVRVQKQTRTGFGRFCNMLTGETEQRQAEINQNLVEGLNVTVDCLMELACSQERSNLAIARIHERLALLNQDIAILADHANETRDMLKLFHTQVADRFGRLEATLMQIDMRTLAQQQLDHVFFKWEAGNYHKLSFAGRCFMALDELYWGRAGDYLRANRDVLMLETIQNRCTLQMSKDARVEINQRLGTEFWLNSQSAALQDMEAMAFQGDWSDSLSGAFVHVVSKNILDSGKWPNAVPRRIDTARLSEGLFRETILARVS